ncbi:MAG: hypothetical protein K2X66_00470 [Cyanobacteria bacterium]|nr:hypothetical protein [Cyanobacteriota bacterium]
MPSIGPKFISSIRPTVNQVGNSPGIQSNQTSPPQDNTMLASFSTFGPDSTQGDPAPPFPIDGPGSGLPINLRPPTTTPAGYIPPPKPKGGNNPADKIPGPIIDKPPSKGPQS